MFSEKNSFLPAFLSERNYYFEATSKKMYIPQAFKIEDPRKIAEIIEKYSFATLITCNEGVPNASHIPFLFNCDRSEHGTLISHMAKVNPQWQEFNSQSEVLVVFQGSHSYISPTWYANQPAVCTWNYVAVHAYGIPQLIENEQRVWDILQATVDKYEVNLANPWDGSLPEKFRNQLSKALIGFEIALTRIEAKFKLGQNRSPEDLQGVYEALVNSADPNQRQLAAMMKQEHLVS